MRLRYFQIQSVISTISLNLYDNQLTTLPESIVKLTNLTTLWLLLNQLTTLPDSFGNLTKLTYLDLRSNPISEAEQARIQSLLPNCEIEF